MRIVGPLLGGLTALVCLACHTSGSGSPSSARPPAPGEIPERIDVAAGTLTTGFAIGQLHLTVAVAPSSVTATPITVARYRQCVRAGACSVPASRSDACTGARPVDTLVDGPTYSDDAKSDALPVTCVTPSQAIAYCSWQGASLPTIHQWLAAARGATPLRHPWGAEAATCAQHARGQLDTSLGARCCDGTCNAQDLFAVGQHPAGASPSGMQDVLLTSGELLRGSGDTEVAACNGGEGTTCVVRGLDPGAIDGAIQLPPDPTPSPEAPTYGFRCAWSK